MNSRRALAILSVHFQFALAAAVLGYVSLRLLPHLSPLQIVVGPGVWLLVAWLAAGTLALALVWVRAQRTARAFGMARGLLYCLCGGVTVYLLAFQPFARLSAELALGCAIATWAIGIAAWRTVARTLPRGLLRGFDILLFHLCGLLLVGELGLRALAWIRPSPLLSRGDARAVERIEAYRLPPGKILWGSRVNSQGFFDEEFLPPDQRTGPVVAMIGDSFQVGIVPFAYHFTSVCERELGDAARVYSVGVAAVGFPEYQHLLETVVMPLRPEVIVVGVFIGNDLVAGAPRREDSPALRPWFDRDRVLVSVLARRLLLVAEAGRGTLEAAEDAGRSTLVTDPSEFVRLWPWLEDHTREAPTFPVQSYLDLEAGRAWMVCDPGRVQWQEAYDILLQMRARAAGIPFAVVLIPDEFQVEDDLWEQILARGVPPEIDRFLAQRLVGEFLRAHGIPYLDLLPVLRALPKESDGRRHCYHLRDTHLNARGNLHAGRALAGFLRPLLPRAGGR